MKKKSKRRSRAYVAGVTHAASVIEMVNLMYQKNTAKNFMRGLVSTLQVLLYKAEKRNMASEIKVFI